MGGSLCKITWKVLLTKQACLPENLVLHVSLCSTENGELGNNAAKHMEQSGIHLFPLFTLDIADQWVQLITSQWILTHTGMILIHCTVRYNQMLIDNTYPRTLYQTISPIPLNANPHGHEILMHRTMRHSPMLMDNTLPCTPYQFSSPCQLQEGNLLHLKRSSSPGENQKPKLS